MQGLVGGFAERRCRTVGGSLGLASRAAPGLRERGGMSGEATRTGASAMARRWSVDLAMLVAIGLLMGFLGPFGSDRIPDAYRYIY